MSEAHRITAPSTAESLRVVFVGGDQVWNVGEVGYNERWATFRSGGTRYSVPLTSILYIATHSAAGPAKAGLHDGSHAPDCLVCHPVETTKPPPEVGV